MAVSRHGGKMDKTFAQKHAITIILVAALGWGIVGVLAFEPTGPLPYRPLEHLFMALTISGVLGLIIEYTLHQQIAKDVFEAAIGYLLPEELRDELRWVAGQPFLCEKHTQTTT